MSILFFRLYVFFFFNDTATTEIYTLSLHDALPIFEGPLRGEPDGLQRLAPVVADVPVELRVLLGGDVLLRARPQRLADRKSTRLNSSHANISYAVFCLKKKNTQRHTTTNIAPLISLD